MLRDTLKEFIEFEGRAFLEVMTDPDACVYPMVGPGMGYKEMITGDYIVSRESRGEGTEETSPPTEAF